MWSYILVESSSLNFLKGSEQSTAMEWEGVGGGGLRLAIPSITEGMLTSTGGRRLAVL